jgi:hypothetical protein
MLLFGIDDNLATLLHLHCAPAPASIQIQELEETVAKKLAELTLLQKQNQKLKDRGRMLEVSDVGLHNTWDVRKECTTAAAATTSCLSSSHSGSTSSRIGCTCSG